MGGVRVGLVGEGGGGGVGGTQKVAKFNKVAKFKNMRYSRLCGILHVAKFIFFRKAQAFVSFRPSCRSD